MALSEQAELAVRISLKDNVSPGVSKLQRNLGGLNTSLSRTGRGVGQVGAGLLRAGVLIGTAVGGGLIYAAKQATTFASEMELVATQAGASQGEVDSLSQAILQLAPSLGTTPVELAQGLFHVESAGLRGAQALDVLKTAAMGAAVGHANLEDTTNALIATVTTGIGGVSSMSQAMGVLNAIVGSGNLRMEDLASAMSSGVLSVASTFGVSLESVGGALAELTRQGIPAEEASTRLRMSISLLGAPTSKATRLLKGIGIGPQQLAKDMRTPGGILTALTDLKTHLDASGLSAVEQSQLLSRAFGGGRSSATILALLNQLGDFKTVQDQVNAGTGTFGDAWKKTTEEAGFAFRGFRAGVEADAIILGGAISSSAGRAFNKITAILADPATQAALKNFGADIGAAIDNINWDDVKSGAITFAGLLKGAASAALSILQAINLLPGPIKEAGLGFLTLNKLSGGLIGAGAGNIFGGLAEAIAKGLATKLPGVGSLFAQPVFVTNWAMIAGGKGLPGGPGGVPGAAGGGALALGIAAAAPAITGLVTGFLADQFNNNPERTRLGVGELKPVFSPFDIANVTNFATVIDTAVRAWNTRNDLPPAPFHTDPKERQYAQSTKYTGIPYTPTRSRTRMGDPKDQTPVVPKAIDVAGPTSRSTASAQVAATNMTRSAVLAGGAGMIGAIRALNLSPTINVTAPVSISVSSVTSATHTTATYSSGTIATRIAGGQVYGI